MHVHRITIFAPSHEDIKTSHAAAAAVAKKPAAGKRLMCKTSHAAAAAVAKKPAAAATSHDSE